MLRLRKKHLPKQKRKISGASRFEPLDAEYAGYLPYLFYVVAEWKRAEPKTDPSLLTSPIFAASGMAWLVKQNVPICSTGPMMTNWLVVGPPL